LRTPNVEAFQTSLLAAAIVTVVWFAPPVPTVN